MGFILGVIIVAEGFRHVVSTWGLLAGLTDVDIAGHRDTVHR